MGLIHARILEWVSMPSSREPSPPRDQTQGSCVSCIAGKFLTTDSNCEAPRNGCRHLGGLSRFWLFQTLDCSPPGSSVHGIFQVRLLEWVAMLSSRGSFWPRDRTCVSYIYPHWQAGSLPLAPPGKPQLFMFIPFYFLFYILHIL